LKNNVYNYELKHVYCHTRFSKDFEKNVKNYELKNIYCHTRFSTLNVHVYYFRWRNSLHKMEILKLVIL